jgi:hypothetical protein
MELALPGNPTIAVFRVGSGRFMQWIVQQPRFDTRAPESGRERATLWMQQRGHSDGHSELTTVSGKGSVVPDPGRGRGSVALFCTVGVGRGSGPDVVLVPMA